MFKGLVTDELQSLMQVRMLQILRDALVTWSC